MRAALLVVLAGCQLFVPELHRRDGGRTDTGAGPDAFAVPHCSVPILEPGVPLDGLQAIVGDDPVLRNDRLEIFYVAGNPHKIYRATRTTPTAAFAIDPALLPFNAGSTVRDESPAIDLTATRLVFTSDRNTPGTTHAYEVIRTADTWSIPMQVLGLENQTLSYLDLSYDGLVIDYINGTNLYQVSRASLDLPFDNSNRRLVGTTIQSPSLSADRLEIYYRDPSTTTIVYARRANPLDTFPAGLPVAQITGMHYDPDLLPDGSALVIEGPVLYPRTCN